MSNKQSIKNLQENLLPKTLERKGIEKLERIVNRFGKNQNVFKVLNSSGKPYFIKVGECDSVKNEVLAYKHLKKYLPIPKMIKYGIKDSLGYIIYHFAENSRILSDVWNYETGELSMDGLLDMEQKRYSLLANLYKRNKKKMQFGDIVRCRANQLFLKRLLGDRFAKYFLSPNTIGSYFTKEFIINENKIDLTIGEILHNINCRLWAGLHSKKYDVVIKGTGDAHNNNILIGQDDQIFFTDFEYYGTHPLTLELAKPYYIDFLGNYFFHYPDELKNFYQIDWIENSKQVTVNFIIKKIPRKEIMLTEVKIAALKELSGDLEQGALLFKDYLLLCHILDRDPNTYSMFNQRLFLLFIFFLSFFDPLRPDSLFDSICD